MSDHGYAESLGIQLGREIYDLECRIKKLEAVLKERAQEHCCDNKFHCTGRTVPAEAPR